MRVLLLLPLLLLIVSCAERNDPRWLVDGHAFAPPDTASAMPPADAAMAIPEEKPIVRVISGTEVSGVDEALALLDRPPALENLGLRTMVDRLSLKEMPLADLAALLSEMSGYNITVTGEAGEKRVSIHLQELSLRHALEAICRLNNLWYREDERIVTLMTTEEYGREMVIRRNEKSRAYWLRYTNANDMAKILQAVMGSQVRFNDIGEEKVYGHVDEKKEAGSAITVSDEEEPVGRIRSGEQVVINGLELNTAELRRLLGLGELREGGGDALAMLEKLERKVPAVITVFKRNNSILARSLDETVLADIGRIIELMDTPTHQVLLEISILQLTLGDGYESFFQLTWPGSYSYDYPDDIWVPGEKGLPTANSQDDFDSLEYAGRKNIRYPARALGSTLGGAAGLTSSTFDLLFGKERIQARLQLYADEDRVEVVATPYLMSANNARVEFFVGEEVPLRDDVKSETLFNEAGNITTNVFEVTIKREELGTDIEIASFINEDGTITMDLEAEISSPSYNITSIGVINNVTGEVVPFPLDGVNRSELNSIVTAVSGQPIAIGGIIREQLQEYEKKVPVLGDIPILGFPFKEVKDRKTKTETVILLTPHIIRHPALAWQQSREFLDRRSSHPRFTRDQEHILDYPSAVKPLPAMEKGE